MLVRILVAVLAGFLSGGCSSNSAGVYHTVARGQTLYRIAHDYGVDEQYLARINNVHDPTELPVGKRLFIPGAVKKRKIPPTVSPSKPGPASPKTVARTPIPAPKRKENRSTVGKERAEDRSTAPRFEWPLRGKILKSFRRTGQKACKGVEIAAAPGTPVMSAAAGKVTYSGDGIRGFGNLLILRHSGSYFTVYGYNRKNLVETGAYVEKGAKIALSGSPPGTASPRLHFEIRRGKEAVDPIFYLP